MRFPTRRHPRVRATRPALDQRQLRELERARLAVEARAHLPHLHR